MSWSDKSRHSERRREACTSTVLRDNTLNTGTVGKLFDVAGTSRITLWNTVIGRHLSRGTAYYQEALWSHYNQRLAEFSMYLATQQVKEIRGSRDVGHLSYKLNLYIV